MLSVIIPSRNEQGYLEKTIESVLNAAEGEIEVIVVLDGWLPENPIQFPVTDTKQLRWIHNPESIGQRQAINQAARQARGKYIMKLDAHCAVAPGFDVILARDCEYDMTMIPRMYNLDVETWQPKWKKRTDYMFIGLLDGNLRALYYDDRNAKLLGIPGGKLRQPDNDKMIDETMCCMGPGFFMWKDRFWELGGCMEEHGGWGQQGVEESCKAWLSGGRMMVNKNTWFAHWFRGGGVPEGHKKGFPYKMTQRAVNVARAYSNDTWMNNKWPKQVRTFEWLLDKFNPPGWDLKKKQETMTTGGKLMEVSTRKAYYKHMISGNRMPTWMGTKVVKYPGDILLYQQVIYENKPDFIVESGTYKGGSALFFAHVCELMGHGQVITVDIKDHDPPRHPRITHIIGRATDSATLDQVRHMIDGGTVMVILDSNHHRKHVKRELTRYGDMVTPGQFMVVEDTNYSEIGKKDGPDEAVAWFLKRTKKFKREPIEEQFVFTLNPGGWLRRV